MASTFKVPKNNAYSKLSASVTNIATTWNVDDGDKFPSSFPYPVCCDSEIALCTARTGNALTVTRAQEGTTGAAHLADAEVSLDITAIFVSDLNTAVNSLEALVPSAAVLESDYNANTVLYATSDDTPVALTVTEQTLVGRLTGGNVAAIAIGIADNNILQVDDADAADNDYAKFTSAGLEGRSYAELLADVSPLTTRGDIMFRNATVSTRLAKGTDNTILGMGANDPEWKTPAAILADMSGQASGAFDFNSQNVTGIVALSVTSIGAFQVTGNVTCSGAETFDGRDLSVDGTKLDGIEALADVTDSTNVLASLVGQALSVASIGAFQLTGTLDANGQIISGVHQLQSLDSIYTVIRRDAGSGWIFDVKAAGAGSKQIVAFGGNTDTPVVTWLADATHLNIKLGGALDANSQNITQVGLMGIDGSSVYTRASIYDNIRKTLTDNSDYYNFYVDKEYVKTSAVFSGWVYNFQARTTIHTDNTQNWTSAPGLVGFHSAPIINTSSTVTEVNGFRFYPATGASAAVTNLIGLEIDWTLITANRQTNVYGIRVNSTNRASTIGVGVAIAGNNWDTCALWLSYSTDEVVEAGGIIFGSSKDVNLYRSAANVLKTDDTFNAAAVQVSGTKVVGAQQAHIADADGTLADITTKFNTLLSYLDADAGHGLLAGV